MKVLMSAYACEPGAGSEPGAGWAWARAAATRHDVWLLTRANNAPAIAAALAAEPDLRLRPVYLDLPAWARFWKRGARGVHLYYLLWQAHAWRVAHRLHERERFDVAHHVTFATDWLPAAVVWIPGLPAVWGPVGGTTGTPWSLWRWLGARGLVEEALREIVTRPARRVFGDPTARRARLTVAQNRDVERRFRRRGDIVVQPNVALDPATLPCASADAGRHLSTPESPGSQRPRRAVFAGRLVALKGPMLAIAAIAEPAVEGWELDVFGAGPAEVPARRLSARLGVADRVRFHGHCERAEVLSAIAAADALLFPSMHDAAGWVVAEAVALGTPVVCLDRGGPPVLASGAAQVVQPEGRATPARLAAALGRARVEGASRSWSADRLPGLLDAWYQGIAGVGEGSGRTPSPASACSSGDRA